MDFPVKSKKKRNWRNSKLKLCFIETDTCESNGTGKQNHRTYKSGQYSTVITWQHGMPVLLLCLSSNHFQHWSQQMSMSTIFFSACAVAGDRSNCGNPSPWLLFASHGPRTAIKWLNAFPIANWCWVLGMRKSMTICKQVPSSFVHRSFPSLSIGQIACTEPSRQPLQYAENEPQVEAIRDFAHCWLVMFIEIPEMSFRHSNQKKSLNQEEKKLLWHTSFCKLSLQLIETSTVVARIFALGPRLVWCCCQCTWQPWHIADAAQSGWRPLKWMGKMVPRPTKKHFLFEPGSSLHFCTLDDWTPNISEEKHVNMLPKWCNMLSNIINTSAIIWPEIYARQIQSRTYDIRIHSCLESIRRLNQARSKSLYQGQTLTNFNKFLTLS